LRRRKHLDLPGLRDRTESYSERPFGWLSSGKHLDFSRADDPMLSPAQPDHDSAN
jgi:hypothetical protein